MELADVIYILRIAERQGTEVDEPEGMRFITISETLVNELIKALEQYENSQLRSTSDNGILARLTKALYWLLNLYPRRCRRLGYCCEYVYPYGFVPEGGCPIHD